MANADIFNPKNLPRIPLGQGFIGSQGRIGTPSTHPAIPQHRDVVSTPTMPQPNSVPPRRDTGTNPRSR